MESTPSNNNAISDGTSNTEGVTLDDDDALSKSKALYDLVINLHDVCLVKEGWQVFGNASKVRGRRIAIIGAFKVGKTRFTRRLSNTQLKDSSTIPTLGLSMKLPPAVNNDNARKTSMETTRKIKVAGQMSSMKKQTASGPTYDAIYMDTAGTDRPCHINSLANYTATEFFLQDFVISLAQRVILVINKFDRDAQKKIAEIIKKINNRHPEQKINSNNRLLVVHNYSTVNDLETLQKKIDEVGDTYFEENNPASWQQLTLSSESDMKQFYYTTPFTAHVFLLDDDKRKEENDIALKWIRNYYNNVNVEEVDMLQRFIEIAQVQLENFLEGWSLDYKLKVEETEDGKLIKPYLPDVDIQELEFDSEEQKQEWLQQRNKDADLLANYEPFKLQPLQYTEVGVIAKSVQDLQGRVFVDYDKMKVVFQIQAPGYTNEHKNRDMITTLSLKDHCYLEMRIKLLEPEKTKKIKQLDSTINYGTGRFSYKIPQATENNITFEHPKSWTETLSRMTIENGIITLTLDLEIYFE